jgi:hypothetical protein
MRDGGVGSHCLKDDDFVSDALNQSPCLIVTVERLIEGLFRDFRDLHPLVEHVDEMAVAETSFMRNGA